MEEEFRKFIFSGDITKPLDLDAMFDGRPVEVDVGCGMGRFILARAAAHPDTQFIGIERLKPRVEKIAKKAHRLGLKNVFIIRLEATYVLRYLLKAASVRRFYLFFPDPWPKRRHAGHRVFNDEFRSLVWSRLIPGGDLQVATDSEDYFSDMVTQMATDLRFVRIPPIERTMDERTDFELIFLGQGLHPGAAGFMARSRDEIGEETLQRYEKEEKERYEYYWSNIMPHAESVHIVGIGGVGMSAIAQGFIDSGAEVTGSDRLLDSGDITPTLSTLKAQGVKLFSQDGSGIGEATTLVVVSSAIEVDNKDLLAAKEKGVEVIHRSEALGRLSEGGKLIAVAGTSGKSTTTAMVGWLLSYGGLDPTVINGASVVTWDEGGKRIGSVRKGSGEWCVIEADESDRSFLRYHPQYAVVTNESEDHFDMEETHKLFSEFKRQVEFGVVDTVPSDLQLISETALKTSFKIGNEQYSIPVAGVHNVWNATFAIEVAKKVGLDYETIRRGLLTFPGVERRLERIGKTAKGSLVIDDYGHNPAKLSAAIKTVQRFSENLALLWRPHGYGPLRHLLLELADTFARDLRPCDTLFLLPVYDAGGTADRSINSEALADALRDKGFDRTILLPNIDAAKRALDAFSEENGEKGTVLISGARDPDLPRLAKWLVER